MLRHSLGRRPQLTFTSDFHELVQGDLIPGPCVLRYDPLRLIPADNCNDRHEIRAWLRFHPAGGTWEGHLVVPANAQLADLASPTGQGFMLETTFPLPQGCDEIEAWFCREYPDHNDWDSKHGKNFRLRFALHDLQIKQAKPRRSGQQNVFEMKVDSVSAVDSIEARWRLPTHPDEPRRHSPLNVCGQQGGRKQWQSAADLTVPENATVVFDLVYYVGGREFTDDNQGRWYLAD